MKVLFITGTLTHGGAERVISVVSSQLAGFGHDVSVIVYKKHAGEYPVDSKVRLHYLAQSEEQYDRISSLGRVILIRRLLKKIRPDVAVGFLEGGYGMFVSSMGLHFKKVASARINPRYILEEGGSRGILNNMWFNHADAVVMQTASQMKLLPSRCGWQNCTVIPNPVSESALKCPEHDFNRPFSRIVMVGRLDEQKDYPMAIEAMRLVHEKLPDIRLDIYGEGEQRVFLENKISELGLDGVVCLKGWTNDTLSQYGRSDLYLMCSRYEGMPNALMEAMACGLVCISTDCETGPSDLISDGRNGFLIPVGDSSSMAERIISIAGISAKERAAMGAEAKATILSSYSSQMIGRRWEALLESLKERRRR